MFKSNISPLIAEQCYHKSLVVTTTKSGERVIVDPVMTVSRIYMVRVVLIRRLHILIFCGQYFYLFINVGALVGQIGMAYSEKVCFLPLIQHLCELIGVRIVCGFLVGLYFAYHRLPFLSARPLHRTKPLCAHTSHRIRFRDRD